MGKPTSQIIEIIAEAHQPVRYAVTNTEKVILVTYDIKFAEKIAESIKKLSNPRNYFLHISR
jgi:hypothetical protein